MFEQIDIEFVKLKKEAKIPTTSYEASAGLDFYSTEDVTIFPHDRKLILTGITWNPKINDDNYKIYMKLEGRSGLANKYGIIVLGGVIDQDYRGDIGFILYNSGKFPIYIRKGDKIGQGIIYILPKINIKEGEDIENTKRGNKGFGSSDK